jgi:hypothetical protein
MQQMQNREEGHLPKLVVVHKMPRTGRKLTDFLKSYYQIQDYHIFKMLITFLGFQHELPNRQL